MSKGFTLIEVMLVVAVGLIIVGGVTLGFRAVSGGLDSNSYTITTGTQIYRTSAYTKKDGCVKFIDSFGRNQELCGTYQIEGP